MSTSHSPRLGQELSIEVKSTEPLNYFVYTITARGNILKAEHVKVPDDLKSYTIKIEPTFEMIPKAAIFVQYIHDDNLRFEEKNIDFENEFENSVHLKRVIYKRFNDLHFSSYSLNYQHPYNQNLAKMSKFKFQLNRILLLVCLVLTKVFCF